MEGSTSTGEILIYILLFFLPRVEFIMDKTLVRPTLAKAFRAFRLVLAVVRLIGRRITEMQRLHNELAFRKPSVIIEQLFAHHTTSCHHDSYNKAFLIFLPIS